MRSSAATALARARAPACCRIGGWIYDKFLGHEQFRLYFPSSRGRQTLPVASFPYGSQVCEVAIDPETPSATVMRTYSEQTPRIFHVSTGFHRYVLGFFRSLGVPTFSP